MKYIRSFIIKSMVSIVLVLIVLILCKNSTSFKTALYKNVYDNDIPLAYFNSLYSKYLGNIIPFKLNIDSTPVFSENLKYSSANKYLDGGAINLDTNLVPSLDAGLIIFIGEKEGYGNTIIIECENGNEVWYGNMDNVNVKLYDYLEKGTLLGSTKDSMLYLVFINNGTILNYEDFI